MAGGSPFRVLIAKPGLDGHDRGARIIVRALRDAGFEIIYTGIRSTPEAIARIAQAEDVAAVGLSSLSGAHRAQFPAVVRELKKLGLGNLPVIGGGVIPAEDIPGLQEAGVAEVFTPGTPLATVLEAFRHWCRAYREKPTAP